MAVRRASHQLPGIDPRSPMTLSIPQHNLITSFQAITSSPISAKPYTPFTSSPNPFAIKNPTPTSSPVSTPNRLFSFYEAFPGANPPRIQAFTQTQAQLLERAKGQETPTPAPRPREGGSSLKFLLQTGRVPTVLVNCPCGQGRQTTNHILKKCTHSTTVGERQGLLSSPSTPYTPQYTPTAKSSTAPKTPMPRSPRSPRSPKEIRVVHAARKWRMKTLLGKYKEAVRKTEYGYGKVDFVGGRVQKSPRPDVVELGLTRGRGSSSLWGLKSGMSTK